MYSAEFNSNANVASAVRFDIKLGQFRAAEGPHINLQTPQIPKKCAKLHQRAHTADKMNDVNGLENESSRLMSEGNFHDALKILFCLAEGDNSLDGGSLGHAIAICYERMGDLHAARYWYSRAFEENPGIDLYRTDAERMKTAKPVTRSAFSVSRLSRSQGFPISTWRPTVSPNRAVPRR